MKENPDDDVALIVCGDFNSMPDSASIGLIYDEKDFEANKYHTDVAD